VKLWHWKEKQAFKIINVKGEIDCGLIAFNNNTIISGGYTPNTI
jgi:hypothetical protein